MSRRPQGIKESRPQGIKDIREAREKSDAERRRLLELYKSHQAAAGHERQVREAALAARRSRFIALDVREALAAARRLTFVDLETEGEIKATTHCYVRHLDPALAARRRRPALLGLPPATTPKQRAEYAAVARDFHEVVDRPVGLRLNKLLKELGAGPTSMTLFHSTVGLTDAYLQLSVPGFEFPRDIPRSVHFVGTPPIIPNQVPPPPWAHELDGSRKVVLVTQGTVANHNFELLIAPTLAALANEPDVLVVATAGGRRVEAIPCAVPSNARVASYLPFEWLLPRVDVLVTNGGYGSVNQAMSFGIPLVTAGMTEDKADVNARVASASISLDPRY